MNHSPNVHRYANKLQIATDSLLRNTALHITQTACETFIKIYICYVEIKMCHHIILIKFKPIHMIRHLQTNYTDSKREGHRLN